MRGAWASLACLLLTPVLGRAFDNPVFPRRPAGRGGEHFLGVPRAFPPESEGAKATLIYRDAQDKERRAICLLKERC